MEDFRERPPLHIEALGVDCPQPLETRGIRSRRFNDEKWCSITEHPRRLREVLIRIDEGPDPSGNGQRQRAVDAVDLGMCELVDTISVEKEGMSWVKLKRRGKLQRETPNKELK